MNIGAILYNFTLFYSRIQQKKRPRKTPGALGVDDGARTHDTRNHNPMLYQLNYIHHVRDCKGTKKFVPCKGTAEKSAKNQFDADGL